MRWYSNTFRGHYMCIDIYGLIKILNVLFNALLEPFLRIPFMLSRMLTTDRQNQVSKSTQTEYVYVIRAVRSCPVRRRRLPLHLQLHRLVSGRDAVCSKTAYANLDLSTYIFRKASDNLIYEKGKASLSPSYIPSPERHRWKYVTPSKVK